MEQKLGIGRQNMGVGVGQVILRKERREKRRKERRKKRKKMERGITQVLT